MPHSGRVLPVSTELQWLLDHWKAEGRAPVAEAPRPSSAIVLIRDSLAGLETFVTRQLDARGVEDRNRWAFPVSSLRSGDLRRLPLAGWNSARCARALQIENKSRALHHFSAAARIAFAATGILLAENVDRDIVDRPQSDSRAIRARLFSSEVSWSQILRERDLKLRPDLCKPWMRWINTTMQLHRFDTIYFAATVPYGQEVDFLSPNETSGGWMRPQETLEDAAGDPNRIGASTRLVLESLLTVPTVGAAMAQVRDVHPLRPGIVEEDGEWGLVIQPGRDLHRKGTMRDHAVAVGDDEDDERPGFVSLGDDSEPATADEETDES
ncbi:hypothetical protein DFO66_11029 [Brevibacterium sanguinis]|uniref:Nudix hydrolase domain-containing protein n=2 Tax=Brevibacterium TaxID=1696 RepID=A0A366IEQ6_9MICO|nr:MULTISPECIES: hypothetical protein [Brevibacterium]RBP63406.1 hypothetical protein DFO66_11029 [Brevibacterium sanguinis]RBP69873.1 hypothetical protein DFO65_11029 [Brevibacterium celere]